MNLQLEPCIPPIWAQGGHSQTLWAHFLPSPRLQQEGKRVEIALPDLDVLVGRFHEGSSSFILLLFHGLGGSNDSTYIHRTSLLALKMGHSVLAMNHRGCGVGKGFARHPYHSGRGEDVSEVVAFARKEFPNRKIIAAGFSLGANALLNLVTKQRGSSLPDYAIAVNPPTDLAACSMKLQVGVNRLYDLNFVHDCRRDIHKMRDSGLIEFEKKISRFSHLYDIDQIYTAPRGGFESAEDYYQQCSTFSSFEKIDIPTLIVMAQDDPFIPWEPFVEADKNPNVHLQLEKRGGHVGYLAKGRGGQPFRRWLDETLEEALKQIQL